MGPSAVEYVLLLGLVVLVAAFAASILGEEVLGLYPGEALV